MEATKKALSEFIESINKEIDSCNAYLRNRGDQGQTHREDDKCELISFTRGKSVGLVIARDRLLKIQKSL